jgi:hypothetical protein
LKTVAAAQTESYQKHSSTKSSDLLLFMAQSRRFSIHCLHCQQEDYTKLLITGELRQFLAIVYMHGGIPKAQL